MTCYRFHDYVLDDTARRLMRNGEVLDLQPRTFDLLVALVRDAGAVLARDTLLHAVWGPAVVGDAALSQSMAQLRRGLGASGAGLIRTIPRWGYVFEAPVDVIPDAVAATAEVPIHVERTVIEPSAPHASSADSTPAHGRMHRALQWRPALRRRLVAAVVMVTCAVVALFAWKAMEDARDARALIVVRLRPASGVAPYAAWLGPALQSSLQADRNDDMRFEFTAAADASRRPRDAVVHVLTGTYALDGVPGHRTVRIDWRLQPPGRAHARWRDVVPGDRILQLSDRLDQALDGRIAHWSPARRARARVLPEAAVIAFAEGVSARERGDLRSARHAFERALALAPRFSLAHIELAATSSDMGLRTLALSQARRGLETVPRDAATATLLARIRLQELSRDFPAAAAGLQLLVRAHPENVAWRLRLAEDWMFAGRADQARIALDALDVARLPPYWQFAWHKTDAETKDVAGTLPAALAAAHAARQVARRHGLREDAAIADVLIAMNHYRSGDLATAAAHARAAEIALRAGDNRKQAFQSQQLRVSLDVVRGVDVPLADIDALRRIALRSGNEYFEGQAAMARAHWMGAASRGAEAVAAWRDARTIFHRIGDRQGEDASTSQLIRLLRAQGAFAEMRTLVDALAPGRDTSRLQALRFDRDRAWVHAANGDWAATEAAHSRALAGETAGGNQWQSALYCDRGWARAFLGRDAAARADFDTCLARARAAPADPTTTGRPDPDALRARAGRVWLDARSTAPDARARLNALSDATSRVGGSDFTEARVDLALLAAVAADPDTGQQMLDRMTADPSARGFAHPWTAMLTARCHLYTRQRLARSAATACAQARATGATDWRLQRWLELLDIERRADPRARKAWHTGVATRPDMALLRAADTLDDIRTREPGVVAR